VGAEGLFPLVAAAPEMLQTRPIPCRASQSSQRLQARLKRYELRFTAIQHVHSTGDVGEIAKAQRKLIPSCRLKVGPWGECEPE
jgi:hypothetical protein